MRLSLSQPIRCSVPGRAGIIGNPSDMYGGTVISCAIPLRARCTLEPAEHLLFQSPQRTVVPDTLELQGDEFDVCRVALMALGFTPESARFALRIETDIPPQSGLAGSSALLTAIVACLLQAQNELWRSPHHLAERVRRVEAELLKVACGYQDFYMAVFGGINLMDFRDKEGLGRDADEPLATVESLQPYLRGVALPLWLATTGGTRFSGAVHRSLRERWESGETAVVEGMAQIARLARRGRTALLEQDWHTLAQLMNENYAIIRSLGGSGESLDKLVEVARAHGALGAKLAGAGGAGGTIILLTLEPEKTLSALKPHADKIIPLAPFAPGLIT
ncbi:MAG: hypothetical protein K6U12_00070 [Armatimonadetes bacterium]|nr:hypothetical protein [Armatimonadota bacterium]CUU36726.1 D-glycero-alpha-D-manno-heptose-7-phosphate kinase [Armatimonadetes bacterium DC]